MKDKKDHINRKGIILAGGTGSRLAPLTISVSKQLIPIYDKPMIYYPISTLMMAGIREILIICSEYDLESFKKLLNDGKQWGIKFEYAVQKKPEGIAQAFLIAEEFLNGNPCALILGDNLLYGSDLINQLIMVNKNLSNATIFGYQVKDPERYGVINFNENKHVLSIQEKPSNPESHYAVTGLYFYTNKVVDYAKTLKLSSRGEFEITDINNLYLKENNLNVQILGRGIAWFDTGTFDSLQEANIFIKTIENRQGLKVGSPEEISWRFGWIDDKQLLHLGNKLKKSSYGEYLIELLKE
ncbi:glucose-1-phosphate thymidylyltransferase RfbA [Prochlorococcus sp. MIT 0604]|uniref:glucose-1-phosphate thymidylyltransferase RfbA n=1 Tax=Prochlorococcus sp. MIT 0604 TaxID=1501268 RepID=UPI0004F74A3C|nr:glucose-1-phosphate thymidylyltransferase RfbA [Prochlorococcus sp. MIT 0604]AIQ95470.1 Glucose-1-phosphate thymidylyltransferase [Prochlorococcus sp. MIT 0604]